MAIYRVALPQVYGYLLPRCGSVAVAEDLTAETFMAAVAATRQQSAPDAGSQVNPAARPGISVAWLVGVARHKLADHWRRVAREQRSLTVAAPAVEGVDDPWESWLDAEAAYAALSRLPAPQRAALTLRYLDGLPVAEAAEHIGRSVRATETLLVRARAALRGIYLDGGRHDV